MNAQTEVGLLQAMANAKSLEEQRRLAADLEALRAAKREQRNALPGLTAGALGSPHAASLRVDAGVQRHSMDTDWLGTVQAGESDVAAIENDMKAEATIWAERGIAPAVREVPSEVFAQAHSMADHLASRYGEHAEAAKQAFLAQAKHILQAAFGDDERPEYTAPEQPSHEEYGQSGSSLPKAPEDPETHDHGMGDAPQQDTQTDASDTPSLAEGTEPESGQEQSLSESPSGTHDESSWPGEGNWGSTVQSSLEWWDAPEEEHTASRKKTAASGDTVDGMRALMGYDFENEMEPDEIPADFEVQPLTTDAEVAAAVEPAIDGYCGLIWDDGKSTGLTPTPSGRCPFEYFHEDREEGYTGSKKTATEGGQTCEVCGDSIAKDPSGEEPATWHHDNGEKHDHEAKPKSEAKESSRKTAAIPLTNIGIESETVGVGTDPSGNRVRFRLSPEDHKALRDILYSDLAINFTGVEVSEDEIIKESSVKTAEQACVYADTGNCSDDIHEVHSGRSEPTYICGYHEQSKGIPQGKSAGRKQASSWIYPVREIARTRQDGEVDGLPVSVELAEGIVNAVDSMDGETASTFLARPFSEVYEMAVNAFAGAVFSSRRKHASDVAETHEVEVCQTCLMTAANGYSPHEWGYTPDLEPWGLWKGTPGHAVAGDGEGHFSSNPCQGCGDPLGGDRYQAFWMETKTAARRQAGLNADLWGVHQATSTKSKKDLKVGDAFREGGRVFHVVSEPTLDPGGIDGPVMVMSVADPGGNGYWDTWSESEDPQVEYLGKADDVIGLPTWASMTRTAARALSDIAAEIEEDWTNVNYAARPYLDAMHYLNGINDSYGMDDARSVVLYFLSNARSWTGEKAKAIKKELRAMVEGRSASRPQNTPHRRAALALASLLEEIQVSPADAPVKEALTRMSSLEEKVGGVSGYQMVAHLLEVGQMPRGVRVGLERLASTPFAQAPSGRKPR